MHLRTAFSAAIPAGVCPLESWLDYDVMQAIAAENNLAETAFFVAGPDRFHLRWFTPTVEMDLCGHATLASAWVLFEKLGVRTDLVAFDTRSGVLTVTKAGDVLSMDFPSRAGEPVRSARRVAGGPENKAGRSPQGARLPRRARIRSRRARGAARFRRAHQSRLHRHHRDRPRATMPISCRASSRRAWASPKTR